ncbi:dTDP-4-dehydrorhamnose reductase [Paraflavitalea sp. CAU 1676]|uniref:dTDP-4-dehydrorhamnose reductase n=1 Tax=Paraflavitalea sp. CAU 1676 TaxID=3032598 RepID=UPI0023DABECB|nr:dTDP-4-dehydrorhamnose reductase [Paraflavitalea sp. CAU 1676]MDF2189751.1 dTDP-4-dehydrorhamnose reductase [Paraflavitalea sp. CAU 1676]
MAKPKILVTGANGQVGMSLRDLAAAHPAYDFVFVSKDELPIHRFELVAQYFEVVKPAYCINAAAYTAVDKAETDKENAFLVNGDAVGVLASACYKYGTRFIHISTDYVFDGNSPEPYKETTRTNPVNAYGISKLRGEALCLLHNPDAVIIRTAWVYSEHGNNFVKTMLRLMKDRPAINVVSDQVGAPTYAADLAQAMLEIVVKDAGGQWAPGIYHYSNTGRISWFDFAVAIKELSGSACAVNPIPSSQYPTPAKRPSFSLLDTNKIQSTYQLSIPAWKDSLVQCLQRLP